MDTLRFNITPEDEREFSENRIERIKEHVPNMLEYIGMYIVTVEMGFQGPTPDSFKSKFDLSSEPKTRENQDTVLGTALVWLENTLDIAGTSMIDSWLADTYSDPRYRVAIAKEIMALCEDLDGARLSYGRGRQLKDFLNADAERFRESTEADVKKFVCVLAGVIERKKGKRGRAGYRLNTGTRAYDISLWNEFTKKDSEEFSEKGPCLVSGLAILNDDGDIVDVKNLCGASDFPGIIFNRMISVERDIVLLNPLTAEIKFDRNSNKWTLSNDILGITSSGKDWNKVIVDFHDYFIFFWETYVEGVKENLSEEEIEIRDYLLSLVPF